MYKSGSAFLAVPTLSVCAALFLPIKPSSYIEFRKLAVPCDGEFTGVHHKPMQSQP